MSAGLKQYEINLLTSAVIEQVGKQLSNIYSRLNKSESLSVANNSNIGDFGALIKNNSFIYKPNYTNDYTLPLIAPIIEKITQNNGVIYLLDKDGYRASKQEDIFNMTYDCHNGVYNSSYYVEIEKQVNKETIKEKAMVHYRAAYDNNKVINKTEMYLMKIIVNTNNNDLIPNYPYVIAAQALYFPFKLLKEDNGLYGPYDVSSISHGQWYINEDKTISDLLGKLLLNTLRCDIPQVFDEEQKTLFWSNLGLGSPNTNYADFFKKQITPLYIESKGHDYAIGYTRV